MNAPPPDRRGLVALVLAVSASAGILLLTAAALVDAMTDPEQRGVSPAFASIITTTLGVVVGGLVGYIGGTATQRDHEDPGGSLDERAGDDLT